MIRCARCALGLTPGEGNFYLVRIIAAADPCREIHHLCTPCYRRWMARPFADG